MKDFPPLECDKEGCDFEPYRYVGTKTGGEWICRTHYDERMMYKRRF